MQDSTPEDRGRRVLGLVKARRLAERRYHKAKTKRARQLAFWDLLQVTEDLAAYRVKTSPIR